MFIGTYEHTIDEKSRLTLPARFRDALGEVSCWRAGSTATSPSIHGRPGR